MIGRSWYESREVFRDELLHLISMVFPQVLTLVELKPFIIPGVDSPPTSRRPCSAGGTKSAKEKDR